MFLFISLHLLKKNDYVSRYLDFLRKDGDVEYIRLQFTQQIYIPKPKLCLGSYIMCRNCYLIEKISEFLTCSLLISVVTFSHQIK